MKLRDVAEQLIVRTLDDFRVPTLLRTRFDHVLLQGLGIENMVEGSAQGGSRGWLLNLEEPRPH